MANNCRRTVTISLLSESEAEFYDKIPNKSVYFQDTIREDMQGIRMRAELSSDIKEKFLNDYAKEYIVTRLLTEYYNDNIVFISDLEKVKNLNLIANDKKIVATAIKPEVANISSSIDTNDIVNEQEDSKSYESEDIQKEINNSETDEVLDIDSESIKLDIDSDEKTITNEDDEVDNNIGKGIINETTEISNATAEDNTLELLPFDDSEDDDVMDIFANHYN